MWSHFSRILSPQSRVSISENWYKIEKFSRDHKSLGWLKFLLLLFILFILFCFKIFGWPKSEGGSFPVWYIYLFLSYDTKINWSIFYLPIVLPSWWLYWFCCSLWESHQCFWLLNAATLFWYSGIYHPQWNQGVHSSGNIVLSLLTLKLFSMILILPSPIYVSILQNNEYLLHSFVEQIWICQNALNMINLLNISIKLIFKYFYIKRFLNFISCFYLTQVSFNQ